jgi:peptidoglycan/LPS O-acetylase OafA/YrhL
MRSVTPGLRATDVAAPAERTAVSASRLAWLDALRGFAALCVVFDHGSTLVLRPVRDFLYHTMDLGQFGVFVFFLVSGYIVPASLERKGSVKEFWISRAFRLYPMYLAALVLSYIAYKTGHGTVRNAGHAPAVTTASWLLMLPNLLSGPNVPNVTWTLSYEMVFYLLLAALFSWRVHARSGSYALICAVGAFLLGGVLPMAWLQNWWRHGGPSPLTVDVTVDALIIAGIALAMAAKGWLARIGATVAALTGLTLATINQGYPHPWSGLTILALMFTGTLVYRAEQGQVSKLRAAWIVGAVLALTVLAGVWYGSHGVHLGDQWRAQWITSIVGAAAVFGVGLAVRNRKIPRVAAWLGLVSYSVYLLHPLVYNAYRSTPIYHHHYGTLAQILVAAALVAVILAASAVTYYAVEKPMQRLGRRVARWHRAQAPARSGLLTTEPAAARALPRRMPGARPGAARWPAGQAVRRSGPPRRCGGCRAGAPCGHPDCVPRATRARAAAPPRGRP